MNADLSAYHVTGTRWGQTGIMREWQNPDIGRSDRRRRLERPIISPVEGIDRLHIASGHEGIGITEGPATGKLVSQLVRGTKLEIDLRPLTFARFANRIGR